MADKKSDENIEYIKEKIADFRHFEDIGLAFIGIGVAVWAGFGTSKGAILLCATGTVLFAVGGFMKDKYEKILRIHGMPDHQDDGKKGIRNRILAKLGANIWLIPFIVVLLGGAGYCLYMIYHIPLNTYPTPFNETTRLTYILYSLASLFGLIATLWVTANRWIKGLIILAIYLFFAGMSINLIGFIIK